MADRHWNTSKENPVDVMFTDMKMPNVGGIELLRGLKESRAAPVSIALSGYDEFELVREAFRLGAYDYLLKSDLNAEILRALLEQLRQKYFQKTETQPQCRENLDTLFQAEQGQYAVVLFSIDDFSAQASRFGSNLHENWKAYAGTCPADPTAGRPYRDPGCQPGTVFAAVSGTRCCPF